MVLQNIVYVLPGRIAVIDAIVILLFYTSVEQI